MADYSYQDLMKMQNDAIRRAEDMQRRARQSAGLEKEKVENQQNQTTKKEEPRRVPMPNDYLENLKNYGSNSSKNDSFLRENISIGFSYIGLYITHSTHSPLSNFILAFIDTIE